MTAATASRSRLPRFSVKQVSMSTGAALAGEQAQALLRPHPPPGWMKAGSPAQRLQRADGGRPLDGRRRCSVRWLGAYCCVRFGGEVETARSWTLRNRRRCAGRRSCRRRVPTTSPGWIQRFNPKPHPRPTVPPPNTSPGCRGCSADKAWRSPGEAEAHLPSEPDDHVSLLTRALGVCVGSVEFVGGDQDRPMDVAKSLPNAGPRPTDISRSWDVAGAPVVEDQN